jgi:hypothetical protein
MRVKPPVDTIKRELLILGFVGDLRNHPIILNIIDDYYPVSLDECVSQLNSVTPDKHYLDGVALCWLKNYNYKDSSERAKKRNRSLVGGFVLDEEKGFGSLISEDIIGILNRFYQRNSLLDESDLKKIDMMTDSPTRLLPMSNRFLHSMTYMIVYRFYEEMLLQKGSNDKGFPWLLSLNVIKEIKYKSELKNFLCKFVIADPFGNIGNNKDAILKRINQCEVGDLSPVYSFWPSYPYSFRLKPYDYDLVFGCEIEKNYFIYAQNICKVYCKLFERGDEDVKHLILLYVQYIHKNWYRLYSVLSKQPGFSDIKKSVSRFL